MGFVKCLGRASALLYTWVLALSVLLTLTTVTASISLTFDVKVQAKVGVTAGGAAIGRN